MTTPAVTYPTFEDWAKGLRFGLNIEDEVIAQVRELAKSAYKAGFEAGGLAALTHPDDADKGN